MHMLRPKIYPSHKNLPKQRLACSVHFSCLYKDKLITVDILGELFVYNVLSCQGWPGCLLMLWQQKPWLLWELQNLDFARPCWFSPHPGDWQDTLNFKLTGFHTCLTFILAGNHGCLLKFFFLLFRRWETFVFSQFSLVRVKFVSLRNIAGWKMPRSETPCVGKESQDFRNFLAMPSRTSKWFLCILCTENWNGRSDVFYRSEFKVVFNCCYPNCCRTNCGRFQEFRWIRTMLYHFRPFNTILERFRPFTQF